MREMNVTQAESAYAVPMAMTTIATRCGVVNLPIGQYCVISGEATAITVMLKARLRTSSIHSFRKSPTRVSVVGWASLDGAAPCSFIDLPTDFAPN